jgi:hypothetical protein
VIDAVPHPADTPDAAASDGDAASYLDELVDVNALLPSRVDQPSSENVLRAELVGPHLRLAGDITLGRFRRLSDVLNHHEGLLRLASVAVLRRNGTATRVRTPEIWVNPGEVTLVGQPEAFPDSLPPAEFRIDKERHSVVVVTPGHALTGNIFVAAGAEVAVFMQSPEPAFIPMTDVRARSLADRRIVTSYPFALLNRRHIVAATETPDSMRAGAWRI